MAIAAKLTAVGNSTGVILPKEVLTAMKVRKGDKIYLTETRDGFLMTPYGERFARQVQAAEEFMRTYRGLLRELAK